MNEVKAFRAFYESSHVVATKCFLRNAESAHFLYKSTPRIYAYNYDDTFSNKT